MTNKYRVFVPFTATATVEVKAENEKEARELAVDLAPTELCHHCAEKFDDIQPVDAEWAVENMGSVEDDDEDDSDDEEESDEDSDE